MLTRKVPQKVSVPKLSDLSIATEVGRLLAKYGYGMTSFGSPGVGIYKKSELKDGSVPVDCWYFFSKREFALFYEVLTRLSESDTKLHNHIKHLTRLGF